jgi:hypothetical protein
MADVIIGRLKLGAIESSDVHRARFYRNKWNADRETPRSRPTYSGLCSPLPALDPQPFGAIQDTRRRDFARSKTPFDSRGAAAATSVVTTSENSSDSP